MRNAFAEGITNLAKKDNKIVLLSGDIGNRLFDKFRAKFPERFYNCGIAEACMTGVASGIAHLGLSPVTYTIATFNTARCLEQIKLDVCYPNLSVVIVGTGAGLSYASLGSTHHSIDDIAFLRTIPNLKILCPSDPVEVKKLLKDALKMGGPVYLRLGKKNEPIIKSRKRIGKSDLIIKGKSNLLISVGNILKFVIEASEQLKRKRIDNSVIDLRYIKPLDNKVLKMAFKKYKKIVVIEEHYISGGVGSSIMEWAKKNKFDSNNVFLIGAENKFVHSSGDQFSARGKVGLSIKNIVSKIVKIVNKT
jgi:transketolase